METNLVASADLEGLTPVEILDDASVSAARELVRSTCADAGLSDPVSETLVAVASELTRNQVVHAFGGDFYARRIARAGVFGVEIVAVDQGQGISQPTRALKGNASTRAGLGMGLGSAMRLADEMDFDVRMGEGTCIRARKFAACVPYRSEVAILGRPVAAEDVSGDDAMFRRIGDDWILSVADGLGHGVQARRASSRAVAVVQEATGFELHAVLTRCDSALKGTRGAVMSIAHMDRSAGQVECVCVGDIGTQVVRFRQSLRLTCGAGYIGLESGQYKIKTERIPVRSGDIVLVYSDGLKTGADVSLESELLREHPIVIADHLVTHYGRSSDDVLVVVVR